MADDPINIPDDAVQVELHRKPVPKKVATGDPKNPFKYQPAAIPADGQCGIGISFYVGDDGWPVVKEIGDGGSAHESGQIRKGDAIFSVDGKPTYKLTVAQVVSLIKGPVDSTLTLQVGKDHSPPEGKPAQPKVKDEITEEEPIKQQAPEPIPDPSAQARADEADAARQEEEQRKREQQQMEAEIAKAAEEKKRDQQQMEAELAKAAEDRLKREKEMQQRQDFEDQMRQNQLREQQQQQQQFQPEQLFSSKPASSTMASAPGNQGEVQQGSEDGFCVKKWPDGKLYRGELKAGRRHGQGSITYPDGASYEGEWRDDGRHGVGEYRYTDGTWYKGQWVNGNREGEGLCTYSDGNMYQGEWQRNLPHGTGRCRFADGSVYKGEFQNGRMHGVGTLHRHDGAVEFHGHWKDGEKLRPMAQTTDGQPDPGASILPDNSFTIADQPPAPQSAPPPEDDPSAPPIKLFVTFQGASHLPKLQGPEPVPSAYVVASVGSQTHITKTLPPNFEPRWDREVAEFNVPPTHGRQPLVVRLFGWNPVASQQIGEATVPLRDLTPFAAAREISVPLLRSDDGTKVWGHDAAGAVVHLMIQCRANGNNLMAPSNSPPMPSVLPAMAMPPAPVQPSPSLLSASQPRGYVPERTLVREAPPQALSSSTSALNSFERARPDHIPLTHLSQPRPSPEVRRVSLPSAERGAADMVPPSDRYFLLESSTDPRLTSSQRLQPAPVPQTETPVIPARELPVREAVTSFTREAPRTLGTFTRVISSESRVVPSESLVPSAEPRWAPAPPERQFIAESRPVSQSMPQAGGRCGVGLKISQQPSGNIVVDKIQRDSAADVDGQIQIGDILMKVDGANLEELWQAKELLLGPPDTVVDVEVARQPPGKPLRSFLVRLKRRNLSIDRSSVPYTANGVSSTSSYRLSPTSAYRLSDRPTATTEPPRPQVSSYVRAQPEVVRRAASPPLNSYSPAASAPQRVYMAPPQSIPSRIPASEYHAAARSPAASFNPWDSSTHVARASDQKQSTIV